VGDFKELISDVRRLLRLNLFSLYQVLIEPIECPADMVITKIPRSDPGSSS